MGQIPIVSLKPKDYYYGGDPIYEFTTSYPSRGVRKLQSGFDTPEEAWADAKTYMKNYLQGSWPGGMGQVIGVTERDGQYFGVVNTYYSPS